MIWTEVATKVQFSQIYGIYNDFFELRDALRLTYVISLLLIFIMEEVTLFLGLESIQLTEKPLDILHLISEHRKHHPIC